MQCLVGHQFYHKLSKRIVEEEHSIKYSTGLLRYQSLIAFVQERKGLVNVTYLPDPSTTLYPEASYCKLATACRKKRREAGSTAGVGGPGAKVKRMVHRAGDQCSGGMERASWRKKGKMMPTLSCCRGSHTGDQFQFTYVNWRRF